MNVPLIDAKFTDAMPEILAGEPWMQAWATVIQRRVRSLIERENFCSIYNKLDEMPEWVLDVIAPNIRAESYRETDDIETKRENIRFALWGNNIKGTVAATEGLAQAVFGAGRVQVQEWFDYDDDPGYFQLLIHNLSATDDMLEDFIKRMDGYKRLSSWLRRFLIQITAPRHDLHMGIAMLRSKHTWMYMMPGVNLTTRLAMCRVRRTILIMDCTGG